MSQPDELAIVEKLRRLSESAPQHRALKLGIGDDCAIYQPQPGEDLLFTTDQMIEDVHFRRWQSAPSLGHRALARSLSDIAAMGGEPRFCLVALAAPAELGGKWIMAFYRGLIALAKKSGTDLAGGDLAHDSKIRCDVMVCGAAPRGTALRRDGAHAGDAIFVSGKLGKPWDRKIEPRLHLGQQLRGRATSCIDLSDGLSLDLHRVCLASGTAAEIGNIPVFRGATLERALHGGEDYELLFTLPPGSSAPAGTTRIGTMVRGRPGAVELDGKLLPPRGYDHFGARFSKRTLRRAPLQ